MEWIDALKDCVAKNQSCVIVMIVGVEGSAPRLPGTRMLVKADAIVGTIGGGALEYEGIRHARGLISDIQSTTVLFTHEYNLSKALSQCCGGKITLQFDVHRAVHDVLHVFGAGHVAQEVARLALRLPLVVTFHDTRLEWLKKLDSIIYESGRPKNERTVAGSDRVSGQLISTNIHQYIEEIDSKACYLVMTHCHEQDLEVVEAILTRNDSRYCGLIASKSKAISFRNRLSRKGFSDEEINQLTAPIGKTVRTGNTPMEVALAAMSDVLTVIADTPR